MGPGITRWCAAAQSLSGGPGDRLGQPRDQAGLVPPSSNCGAARLAATDDAVAAIQPHPRRTHRFARSARIDWSPLVAYLENPRIGRGVLLKPWVSPRKKGVLFVSFEKEWFELRPIAIEGFCRAFDLVLSPSSSPHNFMNYVFAAAYPGPLFTLISNAQDQVALPRVAANFVVVPLYASQWVNPAIHPEAADRARHRPHYDRQLRQGETPPCSVYGAASYRPQRAVLLVGQDQDDRTAATIEAEARYYGVGGRFTVQTTSPMPAWRRRWAVPASVWCCRARGFLRGGYRVAVRGYARGFAGERGDWFAGVHPAGDRPFSERSGSRWAVVGFPLADADYTPRRWATQHLGCRQSTQTLNGLLRQHALDFGGMTGRWILRRCAGGQIRNWWNRRTCSACRRNGRRCGSASVWRWDRDFEAFFRRLRLSVCCAKPQAAEP